MNNIPKTLEHLATEVKLDLCEKVDQWISSFAEDTRDLSSFPTITQIEDSMLKLDSETRKIFLNMISDSLSNIDEKQMISSKKANLSKEG